MLIMYGQYGWNARRTCVEYAMQFSNRRHPNPQQVLSMVNRARETSNLVPATRGDGRGGRRNQLQAHTLIVYVSNILNNN